MDTGTRVAGHYRVLDRVGTGGMGVVWLARDERLQRPVAIKQVTPQPGPAGDGRERVMREARIAARLQHPNAITVFDVIEHEAQPCLVMEYLPSRSLARLVAERGPLPPVEVAAIGRQVAGALAAAHAADIVHRDVKPGNILVTDTGLAKIGDFSVSRSPDEVTVTQTGLIAGTPAYLAPEVARGADPTAAADVFSLGAALYAAVEGHGPFGRGDNQLAMLHAAASGHVQPPRRAGALGPVLQWALAPDPAQRPTMSQLYNALTRARSAPAVSSASGDGAEPRVRAAQSRVMPGRANLRRPAQVGVLLAIAVAVLAVGGFAVASALDGTGSQRLDPASGQARDTIIAEGPAAAAGTGPGGSDAAPQAGPVPSTEEGPQPLPTLEPTPEATTEPSPQPRPSPAEGVDEPIEWSAAGQLVIDYYAGAAEPSGAWGMLTAAAQSGFGSHRAFRDYWSQYAQVWAQDAYGVTVNEDGSVNVPVDVIYITDGSRHREHKVLEVTRRDGQLLIRTTAR